MGRNHCLKQAPSRPAIQRVIDIIQRFFFHRRVADRSDRSLLDGFLVDYKEKGHQVEYLGKEDVEGTEAFHLKITLPTLQGSRWPDVRPLHRNQGRRPDDCSLNHRVRGIERGGRPLEVRNATVTEQPGLYALGSSRLTDGSNQSKSKTVAKRPLR